ATRSSATARSPLRVLVVVVQLEQQAARVRAERPVRRARGPARVRIRAELRSALAVPVAADDEVARHEVHLLPVVVHERLGRVHAGREAQMARAEAAPGLLVEEAREDLLLDARRIAFRRLPALAEIDGVELLVLLVDRHRRSPRSVRD